MIKIEKSLKANIIIEFSQLNGLNDVKLWTDTKKIQNYLNSGEWVAYIAKNFENSNNHFIVGAILGIFEEEGRIWIELITVAKLYRIKGIGRALINELINEGKKRGYRACFVDVDDDNYDAIRFYKKVGFNCVGNIDYYYYNNANATIFMKKL